MQKSFKKHITFNNKLLIIGFGSISRGILPLIFRHIDIKPEQVTILTKHSEGTELAAEFGVKLLILPINRDNYETVLAEYLTPGDFLLNLSVDVSSAALIQYCQKNNVLYLDTCIEPWEGGYVDENLSSSERSNYAIREALLKQRDPKLRSTALVAHGANPGLVSHFLKQALLNIARDTGKLVAIPTTRESWAALAKDLSIKTIHIAERDTQKTNSPRHADEFVNTWSVDGFVAEGCQPAELGWGTHEKHWPHDAVTHESGSGCAIYLNRPGATTRVRTWTPLSGPFHGFLITHTESIAIADYFTLKTNDELVYRPTVHFAYHPCDEAISSLQDFVGKEWQQQTKQRILSDEIIEGVDELGVLLMGHEKGAYWFGSQLSIEQTRALTSHTNATGLQVTIGALAGMIWTMKNPERGLVEPDEIDFDFILDVAEPYLGNVIGQYTDWTPLSNRGKLFPEIVDQSDPWQFINMRVA